MLTDVTHFTQVCHIGQLKCVDMASYGSLQPCTHNNSACDILESCAVVVMLTDVTYFTRVCHKKPLITGLFCSQMKCGDMACYGSSQPCTHNNSTLLKYVTCAVVVGTGWRRPIACHIPTFHFLQKSPVISGFFAENDL